MKPQAQAAKKQNLMNPYQSQPVKAFWKPAVGERSLSNLSELWGPKFAIAPDSKVATYGSCFAQHFGQALIRRNHHWLNTEPAPAGLKPEQARAFGYTLFSSRTGNIYTTSLMQQWCLWSFGIAAPPDEIWQRDDRFFDPYRPMIEPEGFASPDELLATRAHTFACFRSSVEQANCLVFTLGLTERWGNILNGTEYPICPGTTAGTFNQDQHVFDNMDYSSVRESLLAAIGLMRDANPGLNILLTVSPVPLTATATKQHVLIATMHSKSILRAVAGQVAMELPYVDYFPSYDIISSPALKSSFFAPNKRDVTGQAVGYVMDRFFGAQAESFGPFKEQPPADHHLRQSQIDPVCDEEMLAAFGADR